MSTTETRTTEQDREMERATQQSLSLVVHRPVADNAQSVVCPQCGYTYLLNCGPRLFYCPSCVSAVTFIRQGEVQPQPQAIIIHALVTAAQAILAERAQWVEQVDTLEARVAELERELAITRRERDQTASSLALEKWWAEQKGGAS